MAKKVVTICDHLFLEHTKSASIGGGNIGVGPTHFEWQYADAQTARFVTDSDIKHARGKGQVAWLLEPHLLHPENYDIAVFRRNEFDAVLVHSNPNLNMAKWYPFGGSWIPFERWGMYSKTKDVSILLSEKNTLEGHRLRHQVVEKIGDRIDVFMGIPDKFSALAPYKFSIIIESESTPDYFTEKIIDCMSVGTIPIYYGSPNIGDHFYDLGIIQVWSLEDIGIALDMDMEEEYSFRKNSAMVNQNICLSYRICEDNIYAMYPELFE